MIISTNNKTLKQIQLEFSAAFPYLRIQFFKESHNINEGTDKDLLIKNTNQIIEANRIHNKIHIDSSMTVYELEYLFKTSYKLNVQVFRKSGNSWLETTVTDSWTLEKQNQEGIELSNL